MTEPRRRWTAAEDALLWDLYQVQEKGMLARSASLPSAGQVASLTVLTAC
jgi:hypothetical protein